MCLRLAVRAAQEKGHVSSNVLVKKFHSIVHLLLRQLHGLLGGGLGHGCYFFPPTATPF